MDRDADGRIFFEHSVQSYALSTRERALRFEPARAVKAPMCDRLVLDLDFRENAVVTRRQMTNDERPTTNDQRRATNDARPVQGQVSELGWVKLPEI